MGSNSHPLNALQSANVYTILCEGEPTPVTLPVTSSKKQHTQEKVFFFFLINLFMYFFLYEKRKKKTKKKHPVYWMETAHLYPAVCCSLYFGCSEETAMQRHEASAVSVYALGNKAPTKKKKITCRRRSKIVTTPQRCEPNNAGASVIRRQCILINIECDADTYILYI